MFILHLYKIYTIYADVDFHHQFWSESDNNGREKVKDKPQQCHGSGVSRERNWSWKKSFISVCYLQSLAIKLNFAPNFQMNWPQQIQYMSHVTIFFGELEHCHWFAQEERRHSLALTSAHQSIPCHWMTKWEFRHMTARNSETTTQGPSHTTGESGSG